MTNIVMGKGAWPWKGPGKGPLKRRKIELTELVPYMTIILYYYLE